MKYCFVSLLTLLCLAVNSYGQDGVVKQVRLSDFFMQSSEIVNSTGKDISEAGHVFSNYWFPVQVPCTVLTGLVKNKIYPDPYIGMNNMYIPDASDSFNTEYELGKYSYLPNESNPWKKPYWYRTSFFVSGSDKGRHFQLIFKGINYRAEVWLNGNIIADSSQMVGMFGQYVLDVSGEVIAGSENGLAVKIFPLDYPGLPSHPQINALGDFYANGGPTGDIGKNVTMLSSVGWDWIPAVRDRNMGIWQPVYLRITGSVTINDPQIITDLPSLPDTDIAAISLKVSLSNFSDKIQDGQFIISISPETFKGAKVTVAKNISLKPATSTIVDLSASDFPSLKLSHPHLWWPNGYGKPDLYRIELQFRSGNQIYDDTSIVFGIRTVSSSTVNVNGWVRRDFYVNGRRINLVGGAWVPDMMLNRDRLRYSYELRLCQNANINLVRIWGGGLGETDDFYDMADKYGLLVWQDFWITGDTNGGFKGSSDWPLESSVFIDDVKNTITRIRNHPSLLVWTGGDEGHARKELYEAMRDNVAQLDGTRPFIPCSSGFSKTPADWKKSWPDNQPSGVYSSGPYSWQDDATYYKLVDRGRDWVFKDETGIPSQPPYNSLIKIIPDLIPDTTLPYPLNNSWGYHDACTGNGKYDTYYNAMVDRYGEPKSIKDFSIKMQLMNAAGYRSIFEAESHKLDETGGVMLWKLNAAFPSVIWQIYDWYLEPNAGYYFIQRACAKTHIQLNLDDSTVAVVNRSYQRQSGLHYDIKIINIEGTSLFSKEGITDLGTTAVKEIEDIRDILRHISGISFVVLQLYNAKNKLLSHNLYWMSPGNKFEDLSNMKKTTLSEKIIGMKKEDGYITWTIKFTNTSGVLAFFLNPQVIIKGNEVVPTYWSDNYFSIAAKESLQVTVSCPVALIGTGDIKLRTEGWNMASNEITLNRL